jgi:arylsulfatase A-like enzyme
MSVFPTWFAGRWPRVSGRAHDSILSLRSAGARLAAFGLFGLVAGFVLFAIETIDRLTVLRAGIAGPSEAVQLAALTGVTILGGGIFGLLLGLAATPLEIVRQLVSLGVRRLRPNAAAAVVDGVSLLLSALAVAVLLKFVSGLYPRGLQHSIHRLVLKFDDRLTPIPFVVAHWEGLYSLSIFLTALAIMWAQVWIFRPGGRWSRPVAAGVAIGGLVVLGLCYQFDSRAFYARYEWTIHYPLVTGYTLLTILLAGFFARAISTMRWARAWCTTPVALALALGALGLGCTIYAYAAMDANQNVKALFWNRSVVARRPYEIAKRLVDRDGDGYSPIFGGGDLDDRDARVHPFAPEIPGNTIDENVIGGDLPPEAAEVGPRRAAPGEFLTVSSAPAPWDPKYTPPEAIDVASPLATERVATSPAGRRPNIIIISIDCLRSDHMSLYGYGRPTTLNIGRYAATGLTFEYAVPHGTNTGHSFSAMLRSSVMDAMFDRNVPTLTQLARRAGYRTAFINARRLNDWLTPKRWHRYRPTMIDDFQVLHLEGEREWTAAELTDQSLAYFDRLAEGQPHFTWLHYMDVHMPREGHPEYGYGDRDVDVYDAEVTYTDAQVGRLLDRMRDTGMLERSIVFITADHGEGFLEHGTRDHSNKPYADNSHVPLVVLAPGLEPARIATPVALMDVAPTALTFAGLPVPEVYRGIDLIAGARLPSFPSRVIVSETPRNGLETSFFAWAYIDWPYKYVYDVKGYTSELYNLAQDPDEQINLVEQDSMRALRMRDALGRWLDLETAVPSDARAAR